MSTVINLYIDQGAEFYRTMTVTDTNKAVINLTNCTVIGQLRKGYTSTTSIPFVMTIIDRLTGKVSMSLSATATAAITEGRYVYDVELTSVDQKVYRILEGNATVSPNVTR